MWTSFKVFIEFVTILLLFYVLVFWPRGMWDLSSPTRDQTHTPCIGRRSLNNWTTREIPKYSFYLTPVDSFFCFFGSHCNMWVVNSTTYSSLFLVPSSTPFITHCWPPSLMGDDLLTCFLGKTCLKSPYLFPPQSLLPSHSSIRHLSSSLCLDWRSHPLLIPNPFPLTSLPLGRCMLTYPLLLTISVSSWNFSSLSQDTSLNS